MSRAPNYRMRLQTAVDSFLDPTPTSMVRAHRIVQGCQRTLKMFTLDRLIWGGTVSALQDSVFFQDRAYLEELHEKLQLPLGAIERAYVRHDFRDELSAAEQEWAEKLMELAEFLNLFPFADTDRAVDEYRRRTEEIQVLSARAPTPQRPGEETVYHLILRQVSAALVNVNLVVSQVRFTMYGHLVADAPYSEINDTGAPPDMSKAVVWARSALHAISGNEWLFITWQANRNSVIVMLY